MPASGNFSGLIPNHVRPCRVPGFLAIHDGNDTVLRSRRDAHANLNPSAYLVWSLCDGRMSVAEIEQYLSSEFPEMPTQIGADIREVLAHLRDIGILDLTGSRRSHPHVRIGFRNFGPEFTVDDNYFSWMLTERFDVLVVKSGYQTPDILFFSDKPSLGIEHQQIDDSETLKVFVGGPSSEPDSEECDYAFSTCPSGLDARGDQHFLPTWALMIDWWEFRTAQGELSFRGLIQPRAPTDPADRQRHEFFCGAYIESGTSDGDELSRLLESTIAPIVRLKPYLAVGRELIRAMSRCKFVLLHGDRTEPEAAEARLLQALYSGAVPIYSGNAPLSEEFNAEAFINCGEFASIEDSVEYIKRIDDDPDLYGKYTSQPALHEHIARRHAPETVCEYFYRALFDSTDSATDHPAPVRPKRRKRTLTIGMATYDDYDGVYFSVQAIRLFHPEVAGDTEILVIDNNPSGPCSSALQELEHHIDGYRYVAYDEYVGTAVRDLIFRNAETDYVLCMDSHVLLHPGGLRSLLQYFRDHPTSSDLVQGPLVSDDLQRIASHMDAAWRGGLFGAWAYDERADNVNGEPFEIPMQGLGVFSCRRDAWPGFNPRFAGFGGEEGYIHEKFHKANRSVLCLPALRWVHRFRRPFGQQYPGLWKDRIRNYLIGFDELGLDSSAMTEHFRHHIGRQQTDAAVAGTRQELASPFHYFDAIYCINLDSDLDRWNAMQERFERLGIRHRVRRFSAVDTAASHHVGCALSHRRVIERARNHGLKNVLVFEDDAVFLDDIGYHLKQNVDELRRLNWNIFYLGGHRWGKTFPKVPGCRHLESPGVLTCTHAVAYNESIYQKILNDIPNEVESVVKWREQHRAVDQYLVGLEGRYAAFPAVASQPSILSQEIVDHQDKFT